MEDWTPEMDEAFNEIEKQSNLGKQILRDIKKPEPNMTDEDLVKNLAWYREEAGLEPAYPVTHPMSMLTRAIAARERMKKREWVGLTDEEIDYCVKLKNPEAVVEEVEAKLKQKNGYAEEKKT